jgi:hypothetical protein
VKLAQLPDVRVFAVHESASGTKLPPGAHLLDVRSEGRSGLEMLDPSLSGSDPRRTFRFLRALRRVPTRFGPSEIIKAANSRVNEFTLVGRQC